MLQLAEILIYPIKSLGGISLQQSKVLPKGLDYDRRWMLMDETNKFMTQRTLPEMTLFTTKIEDETLKVTFRKNNSSIQFPIQEQYAGNTYSAVIWDDVVEVQEVNQTVSEWFADSLKKNCRLVFLPETAPRPVDVRYAKQQEQVSLADGYPFLIIGKASLDDLNKKLKEPILMNRFRPNFVFTGGLPCEEDNWKKFIIGNTTFEGVKPCSRCVLINVDQFTAESGKEPLKTLAGYRTLNNKVYFGQNLLLVSGNEVKVGDKITLQ
ncbi:MAG: MOSC domain-containing protein [Cyclobacteriaceae bacterium]|nr:MOSC domain-containing protein [Cyclobacteriaceae bacterium]